MRRAHLIDGARLSGLGLARDKATERIAALVEAEQGARGAEGSPA